MTEKQYQPGIYVVQEPTENITLIQRCSGTRWAHFDINLTGANPCGEILAGPFTVEQIAAIGEMQKDLRAIIKTANAKQSQTAMDLCYRLADIETIARAALAKFGK